ncbi:hypothetical protein [Jiella pelagia]|uniref:Uncharacterized protein n=1 Tax=Jiella pelagia TaxID=2986949 RepID=A0ABY7BZV1_9HYPH|nr:hypothetical protein [Jiella pelagia]WAP69391.1 hypothetical protein OH818_03675 [Jiella pelagia]
MRCSATWPSPASSLPDERRLVWLLASLYGGAAAAVAATLAAEARGWRRSGSQILALAAAVAAGAALYWGGRADNHLPALTAALTLAIPLAPYVGRGGPGRFWSFALWTAVGVALAFLSVLLFVLGLSAILEMIRFLFEVGLRLGRLRIHLHHGLHPGRTALRHRTAAARLRGAAGGSPRIVWSGACVSWWTGWPLRWPWRRRSSSISTPARLR